METITLQTGDIVYIPEICPNTEAAYGKITKPEKKALLGKHGYVSEVRGRKVYIKEKSISISTWFFHIDDLTTNSDPVNIPQQTFDPENLMI